MSNDNSYGLVGQISIAVLVLLGYPLYQVIYNIFFHPLAHVPGPKIWGASRIPFVRAFISGTIVHDVERLHRKYGPILRIAPNEITFAKAEAWADIFQVRPGHLQFPKDPIWWSRPSGLPESILSAGFADHARMRRLLNHGFTQRALKAQEPIVQKYVALLIDRLREKTSGKSEGAVVDMVQWFNFTTFDIFGDLGFGEPFDCLQHSRYHPWIAMLFNSVKAGSFILAARFYPLIYSLLVKFIPQSLKKNRKHHVDQIEKKVRRRLNWEVERPDLMSHVIQHNSKNEGMTLGEIKANFMILTTAGSETTATALSGTLNYLTTCGNAAILRELVEEVRRSFKSEDEITLDKLSDLQYLNATINEGLRLCPPLPIMLPRLVPEGGDTVCGVWLPAGTSVSLQQWSLFRDPNCFYKPLSFLPERWLPNAMEEPSHFFNDQREAVQPFSTGPRSCMGKNLAWAEMRLILARLLWAFDIEAAGKIVRWDELRTFILVEKKPIDVRLRDRKEVCN